MLSSMASLPAPIAVLRGPIARLLLPSAVATAALARLNAPIAVLLQGIETN